MTTITKSRFGAEIIRTVAIKNNIVGKEAQIHFLKEKGCSVENEHVKVSDNMEAQTWVKKIVIRDSEGNTTSLLKQVEKEFKDEVKKELQIQFTEYEAMIPEDEDKKEFFYQTIMGLGSYKNSEYFQFLEENM